MMKSTRKTGHICWMQLGLFVLLSGWGAHLSFGEETAVIAADTLRHKVLCGYQGWFRCAGDGTDEGWLHWSRNRNKVTPDSLTVEMWPDMSEYSESERYAIPGFTGPDDQPADLFSSANQRTVERHFRWMQQYGIDGVFVQRFLANLRKPSFDDVLNHVRSSAEKSGRVYAAEPQPLIVAHRGLLLHAPENTLANFRASLELRLGFEFDIERTKDGHLVCIHDGTVDRTTNGTGNVSELTLAEIEELDAGSWFDPKFAGEKVPTVEEVLKLIAEYRQHDVLIAVDLKAANVGQDVVRLAEKHRVLHQLLFIGRTVTEPKLREQIKQASKEAHSAAVANNAEEFTLALAAPNADWVYFRFLPTKEQIEAVHQTKKRAFIAGPTVSGNLPDNWQHATNVGMDAILTDCPLDLRSLSKSE